MSNIKVLDCTLRDGGYCTEWRFGQENIKRIISGLCESGVDIIECGFLSQKKKHDPDLTIFSTPEQVLPLLTSAHGRQMIVCMLNYGEYKAEELPECSETALDGIRVAFHKKDMQSALGLCREIKKKGYKVFVQAMVSLNYSDLEFLDLISRVNELMPYCFYIVDSFGVMKKKELLRLFYLVENNLDNNIKIGFHSHNNMQLSYSNAQQLADMRTDRDIIIDSCIFGMGRGAGNLNTELFVEYLNDNNGKSYSLKPLLAIIDDILGNFYQKNYWGYSLPNYLSAKHNLHPNYASYLDNKKTLTVEAMNDIFSLMEDSMKGVFNENYIEELYTGYMRNDSVQEAHLSDLKERTEGRSVIIIAPGPSSVEQKEAVIPYIKDNNILSISINHDYKPISTDFIFVSNLKRFRELDPSVRGRCIITSNIPAADVYLKTKYSDLLNDVPGVHDNAGMMLIRLMIKLGVKKLYIAGMDGYSTDPSQNYSSEDLNFYTQMAVLEQLNEGIKTMLTRLRGEIEIEFVTSSKVYKTVMAKKHGK